MLPVAVHVGGALSPGVEDAEDDAGGPDGGGVVTGAGLGDDAQAAISSPTTMVVATGSSEERIPCPPDGV
jgi:hypothetical protein